MAMKAVAKIVWICLTLALSTPLWLKAETLQFDLVGQLSGWHREARDGGERTCRTGLRYIPQATLTQPLGAVNLIDLEASVRGTVLAACPKPAEEIEGDLYRLKLRFATAQSETRIGLQKINFGPAQLLRPLQWFDNLDPRDPLGLTDGVYALRFRYVALNNASLWLWGLLGNDRPRGYELLATADDRVELGGRLQWPLPRGEGAISFHRRTVEAPALPIGPGPGDPAAREAPGGECFTENRFAVDGRWDIEIGLWFEGVLQQQRHEPLSRPWTKMMTLGGDYTLGIGNGLHLLGEHMATASSRDATGWDEDTHVSALSLSYLLGYSDQVRAIGYYAWEEQEYYQHLSWGRTWDHWMLQLSLFLSPDSDTGDHQTEGLRYGSGYGGQVTVILNH